MSDFAFPKVKPFRDAKALALFREHHRRCAVKGCRYIAEVHHVKNRGTGGGDEDSNLSPLCVLHHTGPSGVHAMGARRWFQNYEAQLDEETAAKFRRILQLED